MRLYELFETTTTEPTELTELFVSKFIANTAAKLGIKRLPQVHFHHDEEWSKQNQSFGNFNAENYVLQVSLLNRHPMDILRTIAHELAHCRQHEISPIENGDGDTGSDVENQANATAGVIMRHFAKDYPEYFEKSAITESRAPTAKQVETAKNKYESFGLKIENAKKKAGYARGTGIVGDLQRRRGDAYQLYMDLKRAYDAAQEKGSNEAV